MASHLWNIGRIAFEPRIPPDLIFFITSRCNCQCYYCLFHEQVHDVHRKKQELNLEEIEKVACNYGRLTKLSLSGGEPFIREDIDEIIRVFDRYTKPAIIDIPTNGFFVERIREKVEKMLKYTSENKPVLEIQLSIDGPRQIHEKVRGVPGIFNKVLQTYWVLDALRQKNPRLRIKMNLTYVVENEDTVIHLTDAFDQKYNFDRFQITFPHGMRADSLAIPQISYKKYLLQSRQILRHSRLGNPHDLHSLVFRAIKMIKDDVLLDVIEKGALGRYCKAGIRNAVIDDQGRVYACEPFWESIGSLRETNYQFPPIQQGARYQAFKKAHFGRGKCNCTWGNAILNSIAFNPFYYPRIIFNMWMLRTAGGTGIRYSPAPFIQEILAKPASVDCSVPGREELFPAENGQKKIYDRQ